MFRIELFLVVFIRTCLALRYDPNHVGYNLNENQTATLPKDYSGEWYNHTYQPSPKNWRFPFYVLTIDRFIDGDPGNNDANGTNFENHWLSNQFRFGGDTVGILENLDYLQGLGIKGIYFTGSMMLNMPWSPDGYGPLDLTLLDRHHGTIQEWRELSDEIHRRGMYFILDSTMSTMGNLLGYAGDWLNSTVEFNFDEYDAIWKHPERRYHDFDFSNERDPSCQMPRIWEQDGYIAPKNITDQFKGCRDSDFDMYGDMKGTGAYPSYINQLSRFASVQDRLREWKPDVLERINVMSCMQIAMLDIDGFRMDKATQITLDSQADFSNYQRKCARGFGKENFFIVGEIVGDPKLAAAYIGRGKQPDQQLAHPNDALTTSNTTNADNYIRPFGTTALDGAAFHYDIYGSLTRFLGLDGPWGSQGVDWVQMWNKFLVTQDLVNAETGVFDPRHMFGTTNQDVFRWPALANGVQRQLLGLFVTTLELPGIPMVFFGDEQEHYVLENLAADYVFGRAPFASSAAHQLHGCYGLGEELYVDMPFNSSGYGCLDDGVSLDHRDPSHRLHNILKRMFELRDHYPVLNDGFNLTTLSTRLHDIFLRGSQGMPTPLGVWSVYRGRSEGIQDFTNIGHGNLPVRLLFHNENSSVTYDFDCNSTNTTSQDGTLLAAFAQNTTIKNLFYPYDEYLLAASKFGPAKKTQGCLPKLTLLPWEFKAFVPKNEWEQPKPVITEVHPGHDGRVLSTIGNNETQSLKIQIGFSSPMDCDAVTKSITFESSTQLGKTANLNKSSVTCLAVVPQSPPLVGQTPTTWIFSANLDNVANGVHAYTVNNPKSTNTTKSTGAKDKFMFRVGTSDNPMIFPKTANYTRGILQKNPTTGDLFVSPKAAGADKIKYSTNWGSSFSAWQNYTGEDIILTKQSWSGTKLQEWEGEHVILQYWSRLTGSSAHVQHSDLDRDDQPPRRWPHAWVEGIWNLWGFDSGIKNHLVQDDNGLWTFGLFTEWPTNVTVNVWGMNPDGNPDKTAAYGDIDRDGVLDWLPPDSLAANVINISAVPAGHVGYKIIVDDGNFSFKLVPYGSAVLQGILALLLCVVPLITAVVSVYLFRAAFYTVKFNKIGAKPTTKWSFAQLLPTGLFASKSSSETTNIRLSAGPATSTSNSLGPSAFMPGRSMTTSDQPSSALAVDAGSVGRRTILIATMEYEIEDWAIKIKIGGLGVMASLMAKNLGHQNLVWVIPCVGDVRYPFEEGPEAEEAEIIHVSVMGEPYVIYVHVHIVRNITFVILDTPIFRQRTKADPYPPRMDDLESGIYYSIWNQCIAETIRSFKPDLYHINDYHGTLAPLYLLPAVIPCALSLHNAEFQGMWPLKSNKQMAEICRIFNLPEEVVKTYVQYGDVFNLLHAAARYLQIHQGGFGAVGVSKKYGIRSLARYPALWGLQTIGSLPNPDPNDLADWDKNAKMPAAVIDPVKEEQRAILRVQAQEWAGIDMDSTAELFVFVGRWSEQKGVDLIADVFPKVLKDHPKTQLICVGPVIDLHGRFAALKLQKLMEQYPGRVCSKPEFTALPPCVFSGAEFALMPSRDEPFGLVAVEFGRKGALCVGSRVGGFGHMPGWWFTVESVTSKHLMAQFNSAISAALASDHETRALMRAYSVLQRFPVSQWVEDLETLQSESIAQSFKTMLKPPTKWKLHGRSMSGTSSINASPRGSGTHTPATGTPPHGDSGLWNELDARPPRFGRGGLGSGTTSRASSVYHGRENSSGGTVNHTRENSSGGTIYHGRENSTERPVFHGRDNSIERPVFHGRDNSIERPVFHGRDNSVERPVFHGRELSTASFGSAFPRSAQGSTTDLSLDPSLARPMNLGVLLSSNNNSTLSLNATPVFTDATNKYYNEFSAKLDQPSKKTNIQEYLMASEKDWFNKFHDVSMSRKGLLGNTATKSGNDLSNEYSEFLTEDYQVPKGAQRLLLVKIGTWSVYSYLLALGQILSASALQLTLLTGAVGQPATKLYTLCGIYIIASMCWWILYRKAKSIYVLSLPFAFFGACFFLLGFAILTKDAFTIGWIYNVATGLYTAGSAAGAFYFALNFGTEGGTPPQSWVIRACIITGTQQIIIAFLWYWGATLAASTTSSAPSSIVLTSVSLPLGVLMWGIGVLLFLGLPNYYRNKLGVIPSFYSSLCRKGVVLWFWLMVILQGYWLACTYGRNWTFLWSSTHAPHWSIACLVIFFFVFVWGAILWILSRLTKQHSWIIPILSIGLGAPGWCQMLWGVSGVAHHIPWAGTVGGALISRSIWLWLGVLHALQGVGLGMILMMTLTRVHMAFVFIAAQIIGAAVTILARGTAPNATGPGDVWLNVIAEPLNKVWFWVCLACQLVICVGYFKFFRKAQLMKP